jgi:single-stranded-DNA-specific exonuclease
MFPLHDPLDELLRTELAEYDDLTAALLARRGILTKEAARKFLNPSYDLHLYDPFFMVDMPKAARRFADAITKKEKIAVWSDYDCDGIPGGILLHDFLKKSEADFENYIPHRHDEGYGMNVLGIEKLAKSGVKLIVTVDSGITDVVPVARAKELGMDVIVTDHHLPGEVLPDAFAVVNPNARAEETYPFHGLCGSGVAWKLVCATLATAPELRAKVPVGWEKWLLDMVGLATIADMVPLTDENRLLATYGLLVMRKSPRIGLQKLCRGMRTEQRTITEDDVGFMIAPRVNAASRMGDAREAFRLFTTTDEDLADELAKKLEKSNRQRKAEAGAITRAVHTRLQERTGELRSVIALGDPEWRPALLGLVANTIADEYERPVFLWGREGNMSLKGSMRSGGATHALDLMRATIDTFDGFGGHAAAGGFTVRPDAVFFLEDKLVEAYATLEAKEDGDSLAGRADAAITPEEATNAFLKKIERLAPFGQQNSKPVFLIREVSVREISRFGKSEEHLKIKIDTHEGKGSIDAVTFFAKGALARVAETLLKGSRVNLLVHLERDAFARGNPVRLRLLDIKQISATI